MIAKAVHSVVNYYNILQITVGDDSEVLYINSLWGSDTIISVEAVIEEFLMIFQLSHQHCFLLERIM